MSETHNYLATLQDPREAEIGTLVNSIILDAIQSAASDIHIEPWESALVVRLRVMGVLSELVHLPVELGEKVAGRLKVMANLQSYRNDLPQEGHAPASPDAHGIELRVSVFPTVRGEKIVLRIFDPGNRKFDLAQLGLDSHSLDLFLKLLNRPTGLILLTGPTGSGKTTAIYAALSHIAQRSGTTISISTVEDPVEFHLPMISQAQINPLKDFTYPVALRSLMRQDPQVIMIGEIRDAETAAIAVQAGLTGHLVISTIHSGSTAGVFARLINMDIEPFLLSSSVSGVVGLRLVRTNCEFCAVPYVPDSACMAMVPEDLQESAYWRKGSGCSACHNTGFSGRTSVTEMMVMNEPIREAILQKTPTRVLQQVAVEKGMMTFWETGLKLAAQGKIPLEELLRVIASEPV